MDYVPPIGGAANDPYIDANPGGGIEGSAVPAGAIEHTMREIVQAIADAGLTPDSGDLTQLSAAINALAGTPEKNLLINGSMRIAQRRKDFTATLQASKFINDDGQYTLDRWVLLSDGNDRCDVTRDNTVIPTGGRAAILLDAETLTAAPNSEKFGICQIIEAENCFHAIGGVVSLSFKARTTAGAVENLRAHVLAWDGTEDLVTRDVVATWGAEGANPTFVANWTTENTAANLALTNSYQTFKVENISIDTAGAKNIAVFIHVDDTDLAAGDLVYITDVQLEVGPKATAYQYLPIAREIRNCQRYFEKSYSIETDVGTSTFTGENMFKLGGGSGVDLQGSTTYQTPKRNDDNTGNIHSGFWAANGTFVNVTVNDVTTETLATGGLLSHQSTRGFVSEATTQTSQIKAAFHWARDNEM